MAGKVASKPKPGNLSETSRQIVLSPYFSRPEVIEPESAAATCPCSQPGNLPSDPLSWEAREPWPLSLAGLSWARYHLTLQSPYGNPQSYDLGTGPCRSLPVPVVDAGHRPVGKPAHRSLGRLHSRRQAFVPPAGDRHPCGNLVRRRTLHRRRERCLFGADFWRSSPILSAPPCAFSWPASSTCACCGAWA